MRCLRHSCHNKMHDSCRRSIATRKSRNSPPIAETKATVYSTISQSDLKEMEIFPHHQKECEVKRRLGCKIRLSNPQLPKLHLADSVLQNPIRASRHQNSTSKTIKILLFVQVCIFFFQFAHGNGLHLFLHQLGVIGVLCFGDLQCSTCHTKSWVD